MNDSATRPDPSRANASANPAIVKVPIPSGAAGGSTPYSMSPMWMSFPFIGGPALAICADSAMRTISGPGRMAITTPRSRISGAITSPRQAPASRYASPRRRRMPAA